MCGLSLPPNLPRGSRHSSRFSGVYFVAFAICGSNMASTGARKLNLRAVPTGLRDSPAEQPMNSLPTNRARQEEANMPTAELQDFFAVLHSGDPETVQRLLDEVEPFLRRIIH